VIARRWTAQASRAQAPAYAAHLRTRVLPALRAVEGYAGALLLEGAAADGGEGVEFVVLTFWRSREALRGFAGADLTAAVVDAEAVPLLTRFDRRARHYELVVKDEV
jgi:heme-degrading monooxygenase HmoA